MAGRSGRRRVDPGSPLVDLDTVFADDAFVDAIAGQTWGADAADFKSSQVGRAAAVSRGSLLTADPLAELLESWRQELAVAPIPAPPRPVVAAAPVRRRPTPKGRSRRPALAIAAAIAALLVGAASIGSKDAPRESPMFALTTVLWPSRADSVASADQVEAILVEARTAIQDGRTQDAQLALLRATVELGSVDAVDGKDDKQNKVAAMWVQAASESAPTGQQPGQSAASARPTTAGTTSPGGSATVQDSRSSAIIAALAAGRAGVGQTSVGQTSAGQPSAGQTVAGQQSAPPVAATAVPSTAVPSTAVPRAALSPGLPTSQVGTPPSVGGSLMAAIPAPAVSVVPVVPTVDVPPSVQTTPALPPVPSTPSPPSAAVGPPVEVSVPAPPSATEQSPPAPTPTDPGPSVEITAPNSAGAFSSQTGASILLDPAATGTG